MQDAAAEGMEAEHVAGMVEARRTIDHIRLDAPAAQKRRQREASDPRPTMRTRMSSFPSWKQRLSARGYARVCELRVRRVTPTDQVGPGILRRGQYREALFGAWCQLRSQSRSERLRPSTVHVAGFKASPSRP